MTQTNRTHKTVPKTTENNLPAQQTFMEHIHELQSRLFYIAVVFLIMAGAAYPFFTSIAAFIVAPLGHQQLVYLTPGGAFGFVIQVCMYVGFVASLPVIIYHLFQFLSPVMPAVKRRQLILFTLGSLLLAVTGVAFAYYVSLPAALYFLTSFNIAGINPMLTIDSYFSFAMAYLIAGAILFQLPLVLLIIDSISPLTPQKLMGYQRHIILGSVIIAAIISPTPDAMNQLLLAAPLVAMYQLGIVLIAVQHKKRLKKPVAKLARQHKAAVLTDMDVEDLFHQPALKPITAAVTHVKPDVLPVTRAVAKKQIHAVTKQETQKVSPLAIRSIDGFRRNTPALHVPNRDMSQHLRRNAVISRPVRSVDGIIVSARQTV